jgi:uncharacterized damage-inducible protein DinB
MDIQKVAVNGIRNACTLFGKDLAALPEDAYDKSFGPSTRTVADIVYEVNLVNDHVGMVIRGEEPFEWPDEGWIKAPEDFRTKEVVVQAFEKSSAKIIATIESFSPEQLIEPIQTDQGETTRFQRCQFVMLHLWYHSGQINYVQTILGDDVWHWQ